MPRDATRFHRLLVAHNRGWADGIHGWHARGVASREEAFRLEAPSGRARAAVSFAWPEVARPRDLVHLVFEYRLPTGDSRASVRSAASHFVGRGGRRRRDGPRRHLDAGVRPRPGRRADDVHVRRRGPARGGARSPQRDGHEPVAGPGGGRCPRPGRLRPALRPVLRARPTPQRVDRGPPQGRARGHPAGGPGRTTPPTGPTSTPCRSSSGSGSGSSTPSTRPASRTPCRSPPWSARTGSTTGSSVTRSKGTTPTRWRTTGRSSPPETSTRGSRGSGSTSASSWPTAAGSGTAGRSTPTGASATRRTWP